MRVLQAGVRCIIFWNFQTHVAHGLDIPPDGEPEERHIGVEQPLTLSNFVHRPPGSFFEAAQNH